MNFLLEKCANVIAFLSLAGFFVGLGYATFLAYQARKTYAGSKDAIDQKKEKLANFAFYGLIVFIAVMLCSLVCLWSRVIIAIHIIAVSCKKITRNGY